MSTIESSASRPMRPGCQRGCVPDRPRAVRRSRATSRRGALQTVVILAALLLTLLPAASPAEAATILVTWTADEPGVCPNVAACSLRQALDDASPGDTIQIVVTGTIILTAPLVLTKHVTIVGPGAPNLAIDGNKTAGVFEVSTGVQAALVGLTIQNGNTSGFGGGIFNNGGTMMVTNSTVRSNTANRGGGISTSGGSVTLTNSAVSGNIVTPGTGPGIYEDGGSVTLIDSTVSGNDGGGAGAAS